MLILKQLLIFHIQKMSVLNKGTKYNQDVIIDYLLLKHCFNSDLTKGPLDERPIENKTCFEVNSVFVVCLGVCWARLLGVSITRP